MIPLNHLTKRQKVYIISTVLCKVLGPLFFACYIKADIQLKMKPISTKLLHMLERNVTCHLLLLTIDVANQSSAITGSTI